MKKCFVLSIMIMAVLAVTVWGQRKPVSGTTRPNPTAKLFGINLIKNGNAESGNSNGWSNSDELKTILYGEFGGGPGKDSPGPTNRGERYFYARTTTGQPTVVFSQKLDITSIGGATDKGTATYNFGGWFGVANGSSSAGYLTISFLDVNGKELKRDATDKITEANRPADEVLVERSCSGTLPIGTRKIELSVVFTIFENHEEQQDNLAFVDNLWLSFTDKGDK